jgi:hypothetical protein
MNQSLSRTHLGLAVFYGLVTALMCVLHLTQSESPRLRDVALLITLFGTPLVLHLLALRGVRTGRVWGRKLSRVLGVLLLFAFPIGTFIGGYILMRTGKQDWQQS